MKWILGVMVSILVIGGIGVGVFAWDDDVDETNPTPVDQVEEKAKGIQNDDDADDQKQPHNQDASTIKDDDYDDNDHDDDGDDDDHDDLDDDDQDDNDDDQDDQDDQ